MQNTSPRSLQPLIRMITPLKGARRKSIANNEVPENKREKLCDCDGDLLDVASINLEQIEFGITIEENKTQSKDNEVIQQQSNQNEQGHKDKQILQKGVLKSTKRCDIFA